MEYKLKVDNIKCSGCTNTIITKLREIDGVKDVHVNIVDKEVNVTTDSEIHADTRQLITKKLTKLGYPEIGTADSDRLTVKAASYVSCALGKVSGKN
ncbi:MAG: heavy-metal-associated domain-containing protein [Gammaproteobacteria bacterium]